VKNRVAEIKLSFPVSRNQGEKSTIQEENDEVKELRMKLANLEAEKSALEEKLIKLNTSFKDLQYEIGDKTRSLENANKRVMSNEESVDRIT
jgi:predicted nuclease with TOPRIM domain